MIHNWIRHTRAGRTAANIAGAVLGIVLIAAIIAASIGLDYIRSVVFWGAQ